jgi:hypothetical protein
LVTTKSNKENIYCDGKSGIPSCLNNGRHYQVYCKILSTVFKKAKQNNNNNQILESNNKITNLWEIVKLDSGRKNISEEAQVLNIDGK